MLLLWFLAVFNGLFLLPAPLFQVPKPREKVASCTPFLLFPWEEGTWVLQLPAQSLQALSRPQAGSRWTEKLSCCHRNGGGCSSRRISSVLGDGETRQHPWVVGGREIPAQLHRKLWWSYDIITETGSAHTFHDSLSCSQFLWTPTISTQSLNYLLPFILIHLPSVFSLLQTVSSFRGQGCLWKKYQWKEGGEDEEGKRDYLLWIMDSSLNLKNLHMCSRKCTLAALAPSPSPPPPTPPIPLYP